MEIEPNDTLATATKVGIAKGVVGFTGAVIPYDAAYAEQAFSGVDFLVAFTEESGQRNMAALLLGPPAGSISAVDAGAFEAWQRRSKAGGDRGRPAPLPEAMVVANAPKLLPLSPSPFGFGVRIQAADASTPPGSQYHVAFVSDAPEGLSGALDLATTLIHSQRGRQAQEVLQLAEARFGQSPQLHELRALKAESEKLAAGSP